MELHFLQPSATHLRFQHTESATQPKAGVKLPQAVLHACSALPPVPDLETALIYLLAPVLKLQSCINIIEVFSFFYTLKWQ